MILNKWILLMITFAQHSKQQNWCELTCQNGEVNTMCKYKDETNINECKDQKDGLTEDGKKRILGLHNYVRDQIAAGNVERWPSAANMRQMGWDDDLAKVAMRWALQCKAGHDKCRRTEKFMVVGQNFGYVANGTEYPDGLFRVFRNWLKEIDQASDKIVDRYTFYPYYGHYTALVWAETHKIGCGLVNSTVDRGGQTLYRSTMTCNYGPGGNVGSLPMWLRGDPCTKCPPGTQCNPSSSYRYLCATPDDPATEVPVPIQICTAGPRKLEFVSSALYLSVILTTSTTLI